MKIDPRFIKNAGMEIYTGTELLVKGALETEGGVHLLTGYPGSPIAGFFDALESIGPLLADKGIVANIANNEALSVAMVNGAQMAGCRAITAFKSVGAHVASDALALGVLSGTLGKAGAVIVIGDDPWSDSTQVPADSRYLAQHLRLPLVEPSCAQEVKDWIDLSFKLGAAGQSYVGYLMTVAMADGGGSVQCRANQYPILNENQKLTLSYEKDIEPHLNQRVLLPPRTWQREMLFEQRFAAMKAEARKLGINRIVYGPQKDEVVPLAFIASGTAYGYLTHALGELGVLGKLPILKLGMSYPVDEQIVIDLARRCERLVVIEERRGFVESQVIEALNPLRQSGALTCEVYGKRFPDGLAALPSTRGLNPSILIERLAPLIRKHAGLALELTNGRFTRELERIERTGQYEVNLPARTPTFCPGCPHRDSSSVLLELRKDFLDPEYMLAHHKRKPVDLVCHGDTGCYTMLMFEPTKPLMHNYSGMGLGGGTGAGIDPFIENKQLVFMGDGTFFHSGQSAISQSIYMGQDIAYIILDNKTTAMTGHQVNPGDEVDLRGNPAFAQDIERIVKGMIPDKIKKDVRIVRIDPADRSRYRKLMEQTLLADGIKIIIADKECGITFHRRARSEERARIREHGYLPVKKHMNIATEVCEMCLECTKQTGCPGLTITDTDYGQKIQTDFSWCVDDGACQRIHACPSFEEVTIIRRQPKRYGDEYVDLSDLPDPPKPLHAEQDTWRCYLAGVGGMGIGLCTAILTRAGHEMGYHVQFLDKKGLAVRNGGVFSQVVYSRTPPRAETTNGHAPPACPASTPQIPYGKADLLLGVDLLEATRAIDPRQPYRVASPEHTCAVVNTAKTPTIMALMGVDDFDVDELTTTLRRYTRPDHFEAFNVGDLCERVLDSKLYANIMMLGMAYQKGFLPLKLEAIESALRATIRHETERNLRAFNIGRKIVVRPDLFVVEPTHQVESARKAFRRKVNTLKAWYGGRRGRRISKQYRVLMKQTFRATRGLRVDDQLVRDVIIRAYDCLIWGGMDYARQYCERLVQVFEKDDPAHGYQITRAVVWNLAKVMLIKDEPYVAALVTNPEKYKRDRRRFNVNPANGDRIIYRHYNVPEIDLFGRTIRLPAITTRDWQHRLLAKMRFLRHFIFKHKRETAFRDWYDQLVAGLAWDGPKDYQRWLAILNTPRNVTGYREVRYPKMDAARKQAEKYIGTDPEMFELPAARVEPESAVSLPVIHVMPVRPVGQGVGGRV